MTFVFDADGRLIEERAIRYNDARGQNEAWLNRNDLDREFRGIRGSAAGEARWEYDSGVHPYIRWARYRRGAEPAVAVLIVFRRD
jgi:hypothetical protein